MKFGGPLCSIKDPSGAILTPRVFGDATLADPSLEPLVKAEISRAVEQHLVDAVTRGVSLIAIATAPDLADTISRAVTAKLGSQVTISMLNVIFPS